MIFPRVDELGEVHSRRPGMSVREVRAADIDREGLRSASIAAAHEATDAFPRHLDRICDALRKYYPPQVLASISYWSLVHKAGPEGVAVDGIIKGLEQHHVELLQALLLGLARWEWGNEMAGHRAIDEVIGDLVSLAAAFHRRRVLQLEEVKDDRERLAVALIQERLRDHTQMVRNWGRYDDMVRITRDLHAPMDDSFRKFHGFGATDLVDVAHGLVEVVQERLSSRMTLMDGITRGRTRRAIVHAYFDRYGGVDGDPEEFLASLHPRTSLRRLRTILHEHSSTGLMLEYLVEPGDLAARLDLPVSVVGKVFAALSLRPGALQTHEAEHLFLANPVWKRAAIQDGDEFLILVPQTLMGFPPDRLRDLAAEAGLQERLERRRAQFLEGEVARLVTAALPSARIMQGVKWDWKGVRYETDLVAVVGSMVLIAEVKSAALTDAALRGASGSARRHVRTLLVDPAIQSTRLQEVLGAAGAGDEEALGVARSLGLGIEPSEVERVIRLSVTLDNFATLASAQAELKHVGWFPRDLVQPATMTLADLCTCVDILDRPLFFMHYLIGRERIQRVAPVFGDELDYLGTYLSSGLDLAEVEAGTHKGMFSRMSNSIDEYHLALGTGRDGEKPRPRVTPYVLAVIDKLCGDRRGDWTTTGLALLDAIPPGTGDGIDEAMEELAGAVAGGGQGPDNPGVLLASADSRRAVAAFHVFRKSDRSVVASRLESLAGYAMETAGSGRCAMFARMLEDWDEPFAVAGWAEGDADAEPAPA